MKKKLSVVLFILSAAVLAQNEGELSKIPSSGKTIEAFIPKGWKQITATKGDLNSDGLEDVVLAIQNTNPRMLIKNHSDQGPRMLNMNDRGLIILFKAAESYVLAEESDTFLPRENDRHSPCGEDPLLKNGHISIKEGVLRFEFNYKDCDWDYKMSQNFTFRYESPDFRLTGHHLIHLNRFTGEETIESADLIAGKKWVTTGGNVFDKTKDKPVTVEQDIIEKQLYLEDFSTGPDNFFIR